MTEALAAEVLSLSNLAKLVADFDLYPELEGRATMTEIAERVRSNVVITSLQRLDLVPGDGSERAYSIGFEAATPEAAAGVANRLASLFADTSSSERLDQQQSTSEFLRRELSNAEAELQKQDEAIAEFREKNRGKLPDELEANLARMNTLDERRSSLAFQIAQAAALASADDSSPELRLARLRENLSRLRVTKTSRHPDVLSLERQIADLEQRVAGRPRAERPKDARSSLQLSQQTLQMLRKQLAETETELHSLDEQIREMPGVKEEMKRLEERAVMLRENHVEVLRKLQSTELGGKLLDTQQGRRVSVLNLAEPPSQPHRTPRRTLALALVASLCGAIAVGIGLELLHPVILSPDDVAEVTGQRVLGWVARIR